MSTADAALPDAFFVPDGELFMGTAATAGPWDQRSMHFGPPAALLGRAVEHQPAATSRRVVRATFEILRPVPVGAVRVRSRVVRAGGRVDLVSAVLSADNGTELALCRAWRIREHEIDLPSTSGSESAAPAPAVPGDGRTTSFFEVTADVHYGTAMDTRFLAGAFTEPGPADVWMCMRIPLVAGETPSPLTRVLVAADSGNGVSAIADPRKLLFINPDLTVHLHRHPTGEWVRLRARTVIDRLGSGLATSDLSDAEGPIGMALQSLFVDDRG
ncbi:MAG TPA: thioesterase family protein [Euzebyales bacterium]|nr:thioesterase family protein [Euzebyales bacterium]